MACWICTRCAVLGAMGVRTSRSPASSARRTRSRDTAKQLLKSRKQSALPAETARTIPPWSYILQPTCEEGPGPGHQDLKERYPYRSRGCCIMLSSRYHTCNISSGRWTRSAKPRLHCQVSRHSWHVFNSSRSSAFHETQLPQSISRNGIFAIVSRLPQRIFSGMAEELR